MNELKPCPFCGGDAQIMHMDYNGGTVWGVFCIKDGDDMYSHGHFIDNFATEDDAVTAWNKRVADGSTSDGYHTFDELYHHRAILFSVIVAKFWHLAWKSLTHADGTMFDGMFVVGIETPEGMATYHYDIEPYWDMFDCVELPCAPEWDGHDSDEAIRRIRTLANELGYDERERELDILVRDMCNSDCTTGCAACGHFGKKGCEFMERARNLGVIG